MALKKWLAAVAVAALAAAWVAPVMGQDDDGEGPKVKQPKAQKAPKAPKAPKVQPVGTGTPLAGALGKMELSDEQKTKVNEALAAWKAKQAEEAKANAEKRKELVAQLKEEKDQAKKAELQKQLKALSTTGGKAQYDSAKAAVKDSGALTDEQLSELDSKSKVAQTEAALNQFDGSVEGLGKKGIELSDEQKGKVAGIRSKLETEIKGLEAGQGNEAKSASMKAVWEVRKDVLTDEQREKLGAKATGGENTPKQPRQSGANKQPKQPKQPKNNGGEGGEEPVEGEM